MRCSAAIGESDRAPLIGVIAPLKAVTPPTSPIGTDTAAAWFYKTDKEYEGMASIASLAGINWVRDRLAWATMQPTPHDGLYAELRRNT